MPGFDGTGPQGRGPMTGNAGGYCLINMPDAAGEKKIGFAGLAGKPVTIFNDSRQTNIIGLQDRLREVQAALYELKWCLANLEAGGRAGAAPASATKQAGPSRRSDGSPA